MGAHLRRALAVVAGAAVFLLVVQWLWGPPAGIVVQGALLGGLTALISLGIALVYRANRILNFAQGDLGAAPASLAVLLVVSSGASWLLAFVTGIVAAIALGAAVEFLVVRRFFRAPRLILSVATIGLAQLLAGIGLLLPRWFDVTTPPQSFPAPIDASFTVGVVRFGGNEVIAAIAVPLVCALLALFLRTPVGVAVRGTAENADRAALLGIPVRRLETLVWAIAAVLAFLAVFLRAGIVGLPIGTVLGPAILLRALAAAVIGGMERLPTIVIAAVGLGIVEQSVVWGWGERAYVEPVLFVIVLAALLLTPAGRGLRGRARQRARGALRLAVDFPTWRTLTGAGLSPRDAAEVAWLLGPRALDGLARMRPGRRPGSASFPQGGFHALRRGRLEAVVSCGPNGQRGIGGHSHNDKLSFELFAGGALAVCDPGSPSYTGDPELRNAFRATRAHATVVVDGLEQAPILPERLFALPDVSEARLVAFDPGGPAAALVGEHRGFARAGVVHRREICVVERGAVVVDRLSGAGAHEVELRWPFAVPGAVVRPLRAAEAGAAARLARLGRLPWHVDAARAVEVPLGAAGRLLVAFACPPGLVPEVGPSLRSPGYGRLADASTAVVAGALGCPAALGTVFLHLPPRSTTP